MNRSISPLKLETLIDLNDVDVPENLMKFKNVSLQADSLACVKHEDHISVIDLKTHSTADLKTSVDSVIINPSKKIIGLKAESHLQVFDLAQKKKINSAVVNSNVEFWQWIDDDTIALVTSERVYHWPIPGDGEPTREFEREPFDGRLQIISYRASADKQWLILAGIAAGEHGGIDGVLQLYSKIRKRSQMFRNSHAGCFARVVLDGRERPSDLFCFTHKSAGTTKLSIVEVAAEKESAFRVAAPVKFCGEQDFAVNLHADERSHCVFMVTKMAFLHLHDLHSGTQLYSVQLSAKAVFLSVPCGENGGIVTVGQDSKVRRARVDRENVIKSVSGEHLEIAVKMAARLNLSVDEDILKSQFESLLKAGKYTEAAQLAYNGISEKGPLRTEETIEKFASLQSKPGQAAPVLQYFSYILKRDRLNDFESIKLVEPIVNANTSGGKSHIEQWIRGEKLTPSEKLGDLLVKVDPKLAFNVFHETKCGKKAMECLMLLGKFEEVVAYSDKIGEKFDYLSALRRVWKIDREKAKDFAFNAVTKNKIEAEAVVDMMTLEGDYKTATSFLLDLFRVRGDREEDSKLQTQLLSINISNAPRVAEAVMDSSEYSLSHYDKQQIASLCEEAEMYEKALENYETIEDIKRCLKAGLANEKLPKEFILHFFGEMSPEEGLQCLSEIISFDPEQNLPLATEVASRYSAQLTPSALVRLFEEAGQPAGLFRYLGFIVNSSDDPEIVFKYIEAAAETGELNELRRICKENDVFEPERVKIFLFERDMDDPRPLIAVCDRFGFIEEMTQHLYAKEMMPFIETYLQKMNPRAAPAVIGALLDLGAPEPAVSVLIDTLRPEAMGEGFAELVEQTANRGFTQLLLPWLERLASEGSEFPALHNALGRAYVEQNLSPEHFIETNSFFDPAELAAFCESRDSRLAFLCFKKARGRCDGDLLRVARENGFYLELAELLVGRQEEPLWISALGEDDEHRKALIAQVVTALSKSREPEEVSVAVKAFIAAELPNELIELLERLVLSGPPERGFKNNKNLQNLLILTAIKADSSRVMSYLGQLSDYDGPDIAKIAVSDQYKLYEEAFQIYERFDCENEAMDVLLEKMGALERAKAFAEKAEKAELWAMLGDAQLAAGSIKAAIESLLKGGVVGQPEKIIAAAAAAENWEELTDYLKMSRGSIKSAVVDSELLFAFCKTGKMDEIRLFLNEPNSAQVDEVGYRCMKEDLYEPAKVLYEHAKSFGHLALCLVNLGEYAEAVKAAEKANNIKTWKVVCFACVDAGVFELAQVCAVRVVAHTDQLKELLHHYEQSGFFEAAISVLEKAVGKERPHPGLITALGVLYCKYRPSNLMAHLEAFSDKINVQQLIKVSIEFGRWAEAVFQYRRNRQFNRAAELMMEHSPSCFDHEVFKDVTENISSGDLLLNAIKFYLAEKPLLLGDFLLTIERKVDPSRVIQTLTSKGVLVLSMEYLLSVQKLNLLSVNNAVNNIMIEEENCEGLKKSIENYNNFDIRKMANELKNHPLRKFRAISAQLFNKNGDFEKALELLKNDEMYEEMIKTVSLSKSRNRAEDLLSFFIKQENEYFVAATLFDCRSLIRPHVAIEVAWKKGMSECAMPFVIQSVFNFEKKLERLEKLLIDRDHVGIKKGKKVEVSGMASNGLSITAGPSSKSKRGKSGADYAPLFD